MLIMRNSECKMKGGFSFFYPVPLASGKSRRLAMAVIVS